MNMAVILFILCIFLVIFFSSEFVTKTCVLCSFRLTITLSCDSLNISRVDTFYFIITWSVYIHTIKGGVLWQEFVLFWWDDDDDDICFVLDQHAELNFYSASSLKQQSLVDMSFHLDTLFWFRANQFFSLCP